tara:strand:- start:3752 stop:5149 length:1398 start_codon:yes stop_codon:yes gene_type:complete
MPVLLSREKSKYGSGVGTIICWPVELSTRDPNNEDNIRKLPAGYLKCDGTIYKAEEYPQLAEILGVGGASKFARRDISDAFIDNVDDDEFIVPDLGSKFLKPTTGGSAGLYINIAKTDQSGQERRRSGMGIESSAIAGSTTGNTTVIPVSYTGAFTVPSQQISLQGKPAWSKGTGNSGFTDSEAVDSQALHAHMHFSQTNRLRIKTTNEVTDAQSQGIGSYYNATTIPIEMWLDKSRYNFNASNPKGTMQQPCWAIASGATSLDPSDAVQGSFGFEVVYSNYCYDLRGASGLNSMRYYCLLTQNTDINLTNVQIPGGQPPNYISFGLGFGTCNQQDSGFDDNEIGTVPATYVAGAQGVPEDWKGVSLADVLPLNQNSDSKSSTAYPQVNNVLSDVEELVQTAGDPTIHNHKILLDVGNHTYKIKTNGFLLSPDNLQTTLTLQIDQVASLDQVTSPYIIMEYLIKY